MCKAFSREQFIIWVVVGAAAATAARNKFGHFGWTIGICFSREFRVYGVLLWVFYCAPKKLHWDRSDGVMIFWGGTNTNHNNDESDGDVAIAPAGHHKYQFLFYFLVFNRLRMQRRRVANEFIKYVLDWISPHGISQRNRDVARVIATVFLWSVYSRFSLLSASLLLAFIFSDDWGERHEKESRAERNWKKKRTTRKNYDVLYVYHFVWHFYDFILFSRVIFIALPFFVWFYVWSVRCVMFNSLFTVELHPPNHFWMSLNA